MVASHHQPWPGQKRGRKGEWQIKKGKGDAEKITDALYCYLRGVVQYPPLPGDSTLEHERAIAGAAQCFRFLSQIDSKAEGKRANKDRADQHVAMLRQRYPNSAFLQGL